MSDLDRGLHDLWERLGREVQHRPTDRTKVVAAARRRRLANTSLALLILGVVTVAAVAGVQALTGAPQQVASPDGMRLAFAGPSGIYLMNPTTERVQRVTHGAGDWAPSWSPDGKRIVFQRSVAGRANIYVMDANGSRLRPLTSNGRSAIPAWSPDGKTIVFSIEHPVSSHGRETINLYSIKPNGTDLRRLTHDPGLEYASSPAWSPDGTHIAFVGFPGRTPNNGPRPEHIYVMKADGSGITRVGDVSGGSLDPAWSPDGTRLAMVAHGPEGGVLETIDVSTGKVTRITRPSTYLLYAPAWTPSGKYITFAKGRSASKLRLYNAKIDTARVQPLTPARLTSVTDPSWRAPSPPSPTPSPPVKQGWVLHRDALSDLTIATPSTWIYRDTAVSGPLSPAVDFAVGTWDFPSGGSCAPTKALHSVPTRGAFFYAYEQSGGPYVPPRPRHFDLGALGGPFECLGIKTYVIDFEQQGRDFTIHVVLGRDAPPSLRREVLRSLDTLTVSGQRWEPTRSPTRCEATSLHPTYLPWLSTGQRLPAPQRSHVQADFLLRWEAPPGSAWKYVTIDRMYERFGAAKKRLHLAGVLHRLPGWVYYYFGRSPQAAVLWRTAEKPCASYQLTLEGVAPALTKKERLSQVKKIATSLKP